MAESENLKKLKRILGRTADLIREAEGTSEPIQVSDMRQKVAVMDIATFNIDDNHVLKGHTVVNGTEDPSTPKDTTDYYRKLLTNFANKVRVDSDKLNIDQIEAQENLVCGVHKVNGWKYGLTIPEGVTKTDFTVFNHAHYLTSINLPNSLTSIGGWSFSDCPALTSINFPDSLTSIGENAFDGCSSLTSITIPSSVTSIGSMAFAKCGSLASITVDEGNTIFDSRDNCNAIIRTQDNTLLRGCKTTIIPNTIKAIGDYAFDSIKELPSITLPDGLITIGSNAFSGAGLTELIIPDSVTSIDFSAFISCNQISNNLIIPNGITKIERFTFYGCSSLPSVKLPDSITEIGTSAFEDCRSMASINLPSNLETIDDGAFIGCSSLTSIKIPKSVTEIGTKAFKTEASGEFEIYFDGTWEELSNKNFEWIVDDDAEQSIIDPDKVHCIHCSDVDYEISSGGGGSGGGSGS